jgi:hypothetical protein
MKKYVIVDEQKKDYILNLNYEDMKGFEFKPKNKIKYDGIIVTRATIINPDFIESILKRKNSNQLEKYLEYILNLLNDDDSSEDDVVIAMDEIERFRMLLINKQKQFLKDKYLEDLLKKIKILEDELKIKRMEFNTYQETRKRSR